MAPRSLPGPRCRCCCSLRRCTPPEVREIAERVCYQPIWIDQKARSGLQAKRPKDLGISHFRFTTKMHHYCHVICDNALYRCNHVSEGLST